MIKPSFLISIPVLLLFVSATAQDDPRLAPAEVDTSESFPDSIPRYIVRDPTRSSADEMTLREIISRAVEGEKTKLAGHENMTFNASIRSILTWKKKREVRDQVFLIYEDDRAVEKHVQLAETVKKYKLEDGEWVLDEEDDKKGDIEVGMETSTRGKDLAEVPFFLRNQEDYDFALEERALKGDHVIFKIRFKPRTKFKPLPSGTVYIDTDNFRVIHEEFTFEENPAPLILKDISRISRQWTELPGGQWVVSKIMGEFSLQGSWMGFIPGKVEVGIVLNDYRFDQGYDERKFGPYEK
jgi:hypothetical protein